MNQHTRRAIKVSMAAAGAATLGVSFVGTAAAMGVPTLGGTDSGDSYGSTDSGDSYGSSDAHDTMLNQNDPVVSNELLNFEMPRMETTSYDGDDESNDDEDGVCHGFGGSQEFGNGIVFQHPCQSHNNTYGKGDVQIAGFTLMHGQGSDDGDRSWDDSSYGSESPFHMAAFSSPLGGYNTSDSDSSDRDGSDNADSDFGGSQDNGLMSMLSMNHDGNSGDVDQDSPVTLPMSGMNQMNGYSLGQS